MKSLGWEMNKTFKFFLSLFALILSSNTYAVVLDVDFNGSDLLLGTFDSNETGKSFYKYGTPWKSSANPVYPGTSTALPLEADAIHIFAHTNTKGTSDTSDDELSFGVILEKPNGSGGGSFNATVDFSQPAELAFLDDPNEAGNSSLGTQDTINIDLDWIDCCTDGFVLSGFNPTDLFIDLLNVSGSDLSKVIFLNPNAQHVSFDFPTNTFNISIGNCDPQTDPDNCILPTPIPAPLALMGLGLVAIGYTRRKKLN